MVSPYHIFIALLIQAQSEFPTMNDGKRVFPVSSGTSRDHLSIIQQAAHVFVYCLAGNTESTRRVSNNVLRV